MQKEITKSLGTHHIMVEKYNSTSSTPVRETPTPTSHKSIRSHILFLIATIMIISLLCIYIAPEWIYSTSNLSGDMLLSTVQAQLSLRITIICITFAIIFGLLLLNLKQQKRYINSQKIRIKILEENIHKSTEDSFTIRQDNRRKKYIDGVEKLWDKNAHVRLGGVHALADLIDEWLKEKYLDYQKRLEEGQVIINVLCTYIRSSFTLESKYKELSQNDPNGSYQENKYHQNFYEDQESFKAEKAVRISIIQKIREHLQSSPDSNNENLGGAWSDFNYDLSRINFFYPVDLSGAHYNKSINFNSSTYKEETNFSYSTYRGSVDFSGSSYYKEVNFEGSTYMNYAHFIESLYYGGGNFKKSNYERKASFRKSLYCGSIDFGESVYKNSVDFNDSYYLGSVNFKYSTYHGNAYFNSSLYTGYANFRYSKYHKGSDFRMSTYAKEARFGSSTYDSWVNFYGSIFHKSAYFEFSTYNVEPPLFAIDLEYVQYTTLFNAKNNTFHARTDSPYNIILNSSKLPTSCTPVTREQKKEINYLFHKIFDSIKNLPSFPKMSLEDLQSICGWMDSRKDDLTATCPDIE